MGQVRKSATAESTPFDNATNGFTADTTQTAIEESKQHSEGFPRAGLALINNGSQSNNDWISYSNLTPSVEIIFPVNTKLNELTWADKKDDVEFDLEIYKNGTSGGDLIHTINVPASGAGIKSGVFDLNADNLTFTAGDWIRIKYKDQGKNTSDLVVVLWISRIA